MPTAFCHAAETARLRALLRYERALWRAGVQGVCGVDEVGLGPMAGPVVAAAVVLPSSIGASLTHLNDSKRVSRARRDVLFDRIRQDALCWAIAWASEAEIDTLNIFAAARLAARRAVREAIARSPVPVGHLLLDAHPLGEVALPQTALIGGDGLSQSVAAASILAKVARDAHMEALDQRHPGYGFAAHKGYPTRAHQAALRALGPSAVHRRSFAPVQRQMAQARLFQGGVPATLGG